MPEPVEPLLRVVRGERVILDTDLARLYGVETKALNRAVKRNADRFPPDFVFQLTREEAGSLRYQSGTLKTARGEAGSLRYQFGTSNTGRGGRRNLPYAFSEHGTIMAANVLNSPQAVRMSVYVVRAFVKMRSVFSDSGQLARKLAQLEKELRSRLDLHETAIVEVLHRLMDLLDPPPEPETKRPQIGFRVAGEETE